MSADERPTSARLREVEAERDEIRAAAGRTAERLLYARTELGRVQRALSASQADLTRAEQLIRAITEERAAEIFQLAQARSELDSARVQIDSDRAAIDRLAGDCASLLKQLKQARAEVLSKQAACGVTTCARCHRLVRCFEPREPMPGAAGYFQHVHCCDTDASVSHTQVPECTTDPTEESR